jgi:hypothetical protein
MLHWIRTVQVLGYRDWMVDTDRISK